MKPCKYRMERISGKLGLAQTRLLPLSQLNANRIDSALWSADDKVGKTFPIRSERFMRPGAVIVVNFDAFTYGYYEADEPERNELLTKGRYRRWLISFQTYGVVARNPRANIGMIYGLPTE